MLSSGWASGDQAYSNRDEGDAGPTLQAHVLMQPEDGEQRHEYVADGGGGENIRKIGERQGGHVTGHECEQEDNSEYHPWIRKRREYLAEMMDVDGSDIFHAACQERISD